MKSAAASSLGLLALIPILFIGAAVGVLGGGASASLGEGTSVQVAGIPPEYLVLFQAAGERYGVPWAVLAGIGKVECDDGQDPDPSCTQEGAVNYAGAGGPMQFLEATWTTYAVDGNGDGRKDRWNPADAIFTAAAQTALTIVLEDIHWADNGTLLALRALATETSAPQQPPA